jgi:hypothetical protein
VPPYGILRQVTRAPSSRRVRVYLIAKMRCRFLLVSVVGCASIAAIPTSQATLNRRAPTPAELRALTRLAYPCKDIDGSRCPLHWVHVSTIDGRFAYVLITAEGYSGLLAKRPTKRSLKFRIMTRSGGGIAPCKVWERFAPWPVLRDLGGPPAECFGPR